MPPRPPHTVDIARVCAVGLLLAIGAAGLSGLHGLHPASASRQHLPPGPFLIAFGAFEAVAAAAVVAGAVMLARRRRRGPPDHRVVTDPPHSRWARLLALLFALVIIGLPVILLAMTALHAPTGGEADRPPPPGNPRLPSLTQSPSAGPHTSTHGGAPLPWSIAVMAAAGVAAVAAIVVVFRTTAARGRAAVPDEGEHEPAIRPEPALASAVAAGTRALRATGDPRAAVIACYAAMEKILARAGTPVRDADTPGEVLARAAAAGAVSTPAATTLTGLFREARYSLHPIDERRRRSALTALDRLRADTGVPR